MSLNVMQKWLSCFVIFLNTFHRKHVEFRQGKKQFYEQIFEWTRSMSNFNFSFAVQNQSYKNIFSASEKIQRPYGLQTF